MGDGGEWAGGFGFVVVWVGEVGAGFAVGFGVAEVALPFAQGEVAGEAIAALCSYHRFMGMVL